MPKQFVSSFVVIASVCVAMWLTACSEQKAADPGSSEGTGHPKSETDNLQAIEIGTVKKLHRFGDIYTAGQPAKEDFALLREEGVKIIVNFKQAAEAGDFDEQVVVEAHGMSYHHIPTRAPETFTTEVFDRAIALLEDDGNRPIMLHCASANRVGPIWIAHRVLNDGVAFDKAVEEARTIGLRTEGYIDAAKQYIEAKQR